MVGGRAIGHKRFSVMTESGKPMAYALFRLGRRRPDGFAKFLEHDSLVIAHGCEVFVNGLGSARPGLCRGASPAGW